MQGTKLLLIDNSLELCQIVKFYLRRKGYTIYTALSLKQGLDIFYHERPQLIIADLMLADMKSYESCRQLIIKTAVPLIILSALGNISDRIIGLEIGAYDYITKPFSLKELDTRIRAILRRTKLDLGSQRVNKTIKPIFNIANLSINFNKREVLQNGRRVHLTEMEFNLLELLIRNANCHLPRFLILDTIWGYVPEGYLGTRVVDVHIARLRSKLEKNPSAPDLILTVRGVGYMFKNSFRIG